MLLARFTILRGIAKTCPALAQRENQHAFRRSISALSYPKDDRGRSSPICQAPHDFFSNTSSIIDIEDADPLHKARDKAFPQDGPEVHQPPNSSSEQEAANCNKDGHYSRRFAPTYALAFATDVFFRDGVMTRTKRGILKKVAASNSVRLPIVTAQLIMKQEAQHMHKPAIFDRLPDQEQWSARLERLAPKGIKEEHILQWAWIASAPTKDVMVQRLLSTDTNQPIFLVFLVLSEEPKSYIMHKKSLLALLDYISRHYISPRLARQSDGFGQTKSRSFDAALNMTPDTFALLVWRLVDQALVLWPAALVSIAHLVAKFIESIPIMTGTRPDLFKRGQKARCYILNDALRLFERPAQSSPLRLSKYNWEAQRILLALANRTEPRLILNQRSYRSIRRVLIRLRKSPSEVRVARRYAKTWPPYRKDWDGTDEQRSPEDDLSRSARAGRFMLEAGYDEEDYDKALTTLGGGQLGGPPSIQTRCLSPVLWVGQKASLNVYSAWAARVRATRNAQEAWRAFLVSPSPSLRPNSQVYASMFEKLFATDVTSPLVVPGDTTREVFPPHDANLSAFEKARLQPPSARDLYQRMLQDGVRPVGSCLVLLILHAQSVRTASQYLLDSPFWDNASALIHQNPEYGHCANKLRQLPLTIFNAWITLLCRLEGRGHSSEGRGYRQGAQPRGGKEEHGSYILRAYALCRVALAGRVYMPPWITILDTLAGPRFHALPRADRVDIFTQVLARARKCMGANPILLEKLGLFLQKQLQYITDPQKQTDPGRGPMIMRLRHAHQVLKSLYGQIIEPAPGGFLSDIPPLYHDLLPVHLYRYLRALASYGDADEMVRVMQWILQAWEQESVLEDAKAPQHAQHDFMVNIFSYLNLVGECLIQPEIMADFRQEAQRLVNEKGCTWVRLRYEPVDEQTRPQDVTVAERWHILWMELSDKKQ